MPSRWCGTPRGGNSKRGGGKNAIGLFCSRPQQLCLTSITDLHRTIFCCSDAKPAGVPQEVHVSADARLVIPMREGLRSLNVALAAAMAAGEALRQTGGVPR